MLLVGGVVHGQYGLLLDQEKRMMRSDFLRFKQRLNLRLEAAAGLAAVVAADQSTAQALARRDRTELIRKYQGLFEELQFRQGIKQFHFHQYPPRSFLRLHQPEMFGDDLSYRQTIQRALETLKITTGLEEGATGLGLRGVAPILYQGRLVGSVEIGSSIERPFLVEFQRDFSEDLTLYAPDPEESAGVRVIAATDSGLTRLAGDVYRQVLERGRIRFMTLERRRGGLAVLIGPIRDYRGKVAVLVEIVMDRTDTLSLLRRQTLTIIAFGLVLLTVALVFVWWVSTQFLAPIGTLVNQSERIAAGEQVPEMTVTVRDEFGTLAQALNYMLSVLEESRSRLRGQARELEIRVRERTAELVQSEEKFRTLVEHIPLVVYRLESSLVRTFVSSHIEKLTGWPPEDLVGGPAVWMSTIHPQDREKVLSAKRECLETGRVFEMEYRLQDRDGQEVDILDHAEPFYDESGAVRYLEGFMMDVRERRRLQDQALQAEELKTLSEISARLAHEFRNPLSVVGLTARRLSRQLQESDPASTYAHILIEQVARLEQILTMIQSYLQPLSLQVREVDPAAFFRKIIETSKIFLEEKEIGLELDIPEELPPVQMDPDRLEHSLVSLIRNAVYQMPPRGLLRVSVVLDGQSVEVRIVYPAGYLPDDQLRHYFFPFTTEEADSSLVDLPLVPVCVHKHNGVINIGREGDDFVAVTISLPLSAEG